MQWRSSTERTVCTPQTDMRINRYVLLHYAALSRDLRAAMYLELRHSKIRKISAQCMPKYYAAVRLDLRNPNHKPKCLTLLNWKCAQRLLSPWERPHQRSFCTRCFRVRNQYGTDGRTDGRARIAMGLHGTAEHNTIWSIFRILLHDHSSGNL